MRIGKELLLPVLPLLFVGTTWGHPSQEDREAFEYLLNATGSGSTKGIIKTLDDLNLFPECSRGVVPHSHRANDVGHGWERLKECVDRQVEARATGLFSSSAPTRAATAQRLAKLGPLAESVIPKLVGLLDDHTALGIGQAVYKNTTPGVEAALAIVRIASDHDQALQVFESALNFDLPSIVLGARAEAIYYAIMKLCLDSSERLRLRMNDISGRRNWHGLRTPAPCAM